MIKEENIRGISPRLAILLGRVGIRNGRNCSGKKREVKGIKV